VNALVLALFLAVVAATLMNEAMKPDPMTGRRPNEFLGLVILSLYAGVCALIALAYGLERALT
jgi:hypothetical protein